MQLLQERIIKDGIVKDGDILKVDSFLNHQIDIDLYDKIGAEFKRLFLGKNINKILTIEASGIGLACVTAQHFHVPVVFAKKTLSKNLDGETYLSSVYSYTHQKNYDVQVEKKFLTKDDRILIIDDFLARGKALLGLIDIVEQSGASLIGAGIVIEKGFQEGGAIIRNMGVDVKSLAIIDSMENGKIVFRNL
ncbi:MAG: xanthine phosphoribosyltransferase [Clostridiales bacterium]|nr:xanthine phosphoribosyltransferase [Clostridiales bacterium]